MNSPQGRATKTSLESIKGIPQVPWDENLQPSLNSNQLIHFERNGLRYEMLWAPKDSAERIFILFSGYADRSKFTAPVFQRWSWAKSFPGHCLFVSDPLLHSNAELGLSWYVGNRQNDATQVIAETVSELTRRIGLTTRDLYFYGSSGGGFAALRMQHFIPDAASIAINPQINILRYHRTAVENFTSVAFGSTDLIGLAADFRDRLDLSAKPSKLEGRKIMIAQNKDDKHHFKSHFAPLCAALRASTEQDLTSGNFKRLVFYNEGGHKAAETFEVFSQIMEIVRSRQL